MTITLDQIVNYLYDECYEHDKQYNKEGEVSIADPCNCELCITLRTINGLCIKLATSN
jgi:hypothetical protein